MPMTVKIMNKNWLKINIQIHLDPDNQEAGNIAVKHIACYHAWLEYKKEFKSK